MDKVRFCSNCGEKLIDNAAFCGNCGTKQNIAAMPEFNEHNKGTISIFDDNHTYSNDEDIAENSYDELPSNDPQNIANVQENVQPQKKKNTGLIIGIVAAVLLVFAFIGSVAEKTLQGTDKKSDIEIPKINDIAMPKIDSDDIFDEKKDEKEEEKEYTKGILTASSYESEFIGVRYTLPSGWALASESELLQISNASNVYWEMQAFNSLDGSNVIVGVEKLPTKNITESMYMNSFKNSLQNNSQITVTDIKEDGTCTIAGKEYKVISYTVVQNGMSCTQSFCYRKINTYIVAFAVTSIGTNKSEILSSFVKY